MPRCIWFRIFRTSTRIRYIRSCCWVRDHAKYRSAPGCPNPEHPAASSLWILRYQQISIDDLRLKREYCAAGRIHVHLEPVHIAQRGLMVTECFHPGEVRDPLSRAVQQRLVNTEVVSIAVNVGNRPA